MKLYSCAGMCKILIRECVEVNSMKYRIICSLYRDNNQKDVH